MRGKYKLHWALRTTIAIVCTFSLIILSVVVGCFLKAHKQQHSLESQCPQASQVLGNVLLRVPSQFVLSIQNCNALIIYTFRCGEHDDHPARKQATLLLHILTVCPGKERLQVYPLEPLFVYVCTARSPRTNKYVLNLTTHWNHLFLSREDIFL